MGGGGGSGGGGGGGVEDLPPIIKRSGDQDAHISDFKGQAVGVDVSVWLHKGLGLVEAARQTAGDVSESGAEDEEDGEEAEEAEAGAEANDERLDIISKAYDYLDKCMARALESGGTVKAETSVKRHKISEFTERQFQSRSGPRSRAAQLRVDQRHEALHQAYEAGGIVKTLMAFYLKWFAEERQGRLELASFEAEGALSLF